MNLEKIAMHIAATNPVSLDLEGLNPELVEKERQVLIEQATASGKPKEIAEKMVEGRIKKFCEEIVLLEQNFVIDGKTKIKDVINNYAKEISSEITIADFKATYLRPRH